MVFFSLAERSPSTRSEAAEKLVPVLDGNTPSARLRAECSEPSILLRIIADSVG